MCDCCEKKPNDWGSPQDGPVTFGSRKDFSRKMMLFAISNAALGFIFGTLLMGVIALSA